MKVHVQNSRIEWFCGEVEQNGNLCQWRQRLVVLIQGKKMELAGPTTSSRLHMMPGQPLILRTGDYMAKIREEVSDNAYQYAMSYEFLFPDGTTRAYIVMGESE